MLILTGIPGSGKSTYTKSLGSEYVIVSQDLLGNRETCIKRAAKALSEGKSVCVDRTNISRYQRRHFIMLAKKWPNVSIESVWFNIDKDRCLERVYVRTGHPTIKDNMSDRKKRDIIEFFAESLESPTKDEGFDFLSVIYK